MTPLELGENTRDKRDIVGYFVGGRALVVVCASHFGFQSVLFPVGRQS